MATILGNQVARAGVPQPQLPVQAARGHHGRRLLPLQVNDAHLEGRGQRQVIRPKCNKRDCQTVPVAYVTSCWQLWRRTCVDRSYMARVPSRYATAMRGSLQRTRGHAQSGTNFRIRVRSTRKHLDFYTAGANHAKELKSIFSHSRFTESHRFHRIRLVFVFVSVYRK